jgi:hypothetical protein
MWLKKLLSYLLALTNIQLLRTRNLAVENRPHFVNNLDLISITEENTSPFPFLRKIICCTSQWIPYTNKGSISGAFRKHVEKIALLAESSLLA